MMDSCNGKLVFWEKSLLFLVLASGVTITWVHHSILENNYNRDYYSEGAIRIGITIQKIITNACTPFFKKRLHYKTDLRHFSFVKVNVFYISGLKSQRNTLQKAGYNWLCIPKKLTLHSSFIWFQPCVNEARRSDTSTFLFPVASSSWVNCTLELTFMFAPPANNVILILQLLYLVI